jgi:hypothetical protein
MQWYVEVCSVALLCNGWVQGLLCLLGTRLTNQTLQTRTTNVTITLGVR